MERVEGRGKEKIPTLAKQHLGEKNFLKINIKKKLTKEIKGLYSENYEGI